MITVRVTFILFAAADFGFEANEFLRERVALDPLKEVTDALIGAAGSIVSGWIGELFEEGSSLSQFLEKFRVNVDGEVVSEVVEKLIDASNEIFGWADAGYDWLDQRYSWPHEIYDWLTQGSEIPA